jgi:hypothetical protein
MSKIIRTTIKAPKRRGGRKATRVERITAAQEHEARRLTEWRKREDRRARATKQLTIRSDGVTRCSKCSHGFCEDCARINKARQQAGLIRPYGSPEPHPNNCMPCIPHAQHYIGGVPIKLANAPGQIVSIEVKPLGGGWYLGQAYLGLECIYERKFRSRDEARRYAVNSMVDIKDGLKFEALLNG